MSTPAQPSSATSTRTSSSAYAVFGALIGLATLAILLQGLWAGLFLQPDGRSWVEVHARGGEVALLLTALAFAWAVWKLRERKDLWVGALVLGVLLVLESYLGGLISDEGKDSLKAVHIPLAMGIMGLAVWLPLRARSGRRA